MEEVTVVRTGTFRETALGSKPFGMLVGAPGFEPGTSCAQGKRATRLRHAPNGMMPPFCQASSGVSSPNLEVSRQSDNVRFQQSRNVLLNSVKVDGWKNRRS